MKEKKAYEILRILRSNFSLPKWAVSSVKRDPFQTLIITIVSQNTTDKNAERAFENLSNKFKITPEVLSKANVNDIQNAIRIAGLHKNKSKTIKRISRIIFKKFNGSLQFIRALPLEKARKTLMALPGVGYKTADVVLLFCGKKPVIPVDTHVNRVSKRLGLVPQRADYEETRKTLQLLYIPTDYLAVHLLFILLGKKHCKARKPLCKSCPLNRLCPTSKT